MMPRLIFLPLFFLAMGCSPLRTSPHDQHHKWELTVHEVQTNLDDVRHDINCFQTEMQILEGRIKYFEKALADLKKTEIDAQHKQVETLSLQCNRLEKRLSHFDQTKEEKEETLQEIAKHSEQTHLALVQFKQRIEELEKELLLQNRKLEALLKVRSHLESLAKSISQKIYKVRPGDSLEKIAKAHKISVAQLKEINHLQQDLIVVGQELSIP